MTSRYAKVFFAFLVVIQFSTIIGQKCQYSNQTDQVLDTKDYGDFGTPGPVNMTLAPGFQPGAVISVVTKTTDRGQTNLFDDKNQYILHVDARINVEGQNQMILSSYLNNAWRSDNRLLVNPIAKNAKVTTTIIYEEQGYRIFINGRFIAFYEHRIYTKPTHLNLVHDVIYKITYLTTTDI